MSDSFSQLSYVVKDGAAWIRFERPESLNAFSKTLYREFRAAIRLANLDNEVDILVLTGSGRAFGTGGDLKEFLQSLQSDDPLDVFDFEDNIPFAILREMPKTTIAAVNGICMAAGLIAAMTCDITIGARSAVFSVPEGRVGLADPFIPPLLFGRVGMAKAKYLMFTGKEISADEAENIGLITEAVDDEELENRVNEVINEVRSTSPGSRAIYKNMINRVAPRFEHYDFSNGLSNAERLQRLQAFTDRSNRKGN